MNALVLLCPGQKALGRLAAVDKCSLARLAAANHILQCAVVAGASAHVWASEARGRLQADLVHSKGVGSPADHLCSLGLHGDGHALLVGREREGVGGSELERGRG